MEGLAWRANERAVARRKEVVQRDKVALREEKRGIDGREGESIVKWWPPREVGKPVVREWENQPTNKTMLLSAWPRRATRD